MSVVARLAGWLHTDRDEIRDGIALSSEESGVGWHYLWLGDRYPRGRRVPGLCDRWLSVYFAYGPAPEECGKPWWTWWDWTGSLVRRHGAVGWAWLGFCVGISLDAPADAA